MLYIISTPIGNLGDVTARAVEALGEVEILLCEDTRVTGKLLSLLNIKNKPKLVQYYDEIEEQKIPQVIDWLEEGKEIGLVTDAGTPLISDPGWKLIKRCQEKELPYTSLPGPSAVVNALVLSGLPTDRFVFLGFLPKKEGKRREIFESVANLEITKVIYESPFRVKDTIEDIRKICGDKCQIRVMREMTKKFEEITKDAGNGTKGEVVICWR